MADLDALKQHISDMNLGLKTTDPSTGAKMKKSEIYSTMPSRVKTNFDIKVDIVPGVGRGIILLEDVKAGDLIFKISNPMFLVVENGEYAMANTCDNCFAANPDGGGSTDGKKVKLSGCVRCKVVHYCGKVCSASRRSLLTLSFPSETSTIHFQSFFVSFNFISHTAWTNEMKD